MPSNFTDYVRWNNSVPHTSSSFSFEDLNNIIISPYSDKKKNKEEKPKINFRSDFVDIVNGKIFFKLIGQKLEDACELIGTEYNDGDIVFVKEYGRTKAMVKYPCIVISDCFSYFALCLENGEIYNLNSVFNIFRFKPNNFIKNYLIDLFKKEETYRIIDGCLNGDGDFDYILQKIKKNFPDISSHIKGPKCHFCGERHLSFKYINFEKNFVCVCSSCLSEMSQCNRCGSFFNRKIGIETRDGRMLCPECSKFEYVTPYHRYYPKIEFFGNNRDNSVPYLGLELEVDFGGETDKNAKEIVKILNKNKIFGYCSHDGSLENGFEIITQPATMEYHNGIKHVYSAMMEKLKEMDYSSHNTTTCGLHIHFNRSFFGDSDTRNLSKFIFLTEKFWKEIVVYSRRTEKRMERYAKKISPIPINEYINVGNKSRSHDYHYYSVNIANEDTIELRTFKGTLNVDTLLATLQLVNNMAIMAKEKPLSELQNMKFEDFLTTKYQRSYWVRHSVVPDGEE